MAVSAPVYSETILGSKSKLFKKIIKNGWSRLEVLSAFSQDGELTRPSK